MRLTVTPAGLSANAPIGVLPLTVLAKSRTLGRSFEGGSLFKEVGLHAGLGRTVAHLGTQRFWKQRVLLLQRCLPFDNALAIVYPLAGPPQALEDYDAQPSSKPASMLAYLNGLYVPDPFYQAPAWCCAGSRPRPWPSA